MKCGLTLPSRVLKAAVISCHWAGSSSFKLNGIRMFFKLLMESGCSPHSCLQFIFKKLYFRTHTPTFSITFVSSSPVTLIAAAAAKSLQLCPALLPPHRQKPTRLPHPWDAPGKNTGVGCHFLLQCMKVNEREVAQSCPDS